MRIYSVGGAGQVAEAAAKDLLQFYGDEITDIIIGDVNLQNAKATANRINSNKISVEQLDVLDNEGLDKAIKDVDIVLNFVELVLI